MTDLNNHLAEAPRAPRLSSGGLEQQMQTYQRNKLDKPGHHEAMELELMAVPEVDELAPESEGILRKLLRCSSGVKMLNPQNHWSARGVSKLSVAEASTQLSGLKRMFLWAFTLSLISGIILYWSSSVAYGADLDMTAFTVKTNPDGTQDYSLSLQVIMLMTVLTFLPSIVVMMTSFTRIIIVLAILRQAMGLQTSPSNQILLGLAFFMTIYIMTPVLNDIYNEAIVPYMNDQIQAREAIEIGQKPLHSFMRAQVRMSDLNAFMEYADIEVATPEEVPFHVLIPAFIVSELKTAFQIGFMLFLPFLIIDLVVASILMAMGMMMLSPMIVSLPFKLMLFVLVDGWTLIMGTLLASYGIGVPA